MKGRICSPVLLLFALMGRPVPQCVRNDSIKQTLSLDTVTAMRWSSNGNRLAWAELDGDVYMWTSKKGEVLLLRKLRFPIYNIAWDITGNRIACCDTVATIYIVNLTNLKYIRQVSHRGVSSVAWSPKGHYFASAGSGSVKIWSLTSLKPTKTLAGLTCVDWSPSGNYLALGISQGAAEIWSLRTGKATLRIGSSLKNFTKGVRDIKWNADERFIATRSTWDDKHTVRIWNAKSGRLVSLIQDVVSLQWSRRGESLACFDTSGRLTLSNINPYKQTKIYVKGKWSSAELNPNWQLLAVEETRGGNINLKNVASGAIISVIRKN